jgi:hypothetical protein
MINAKRRQQELEETESFIREHKKDLEQSLLQISQLSSLPNSIRKLFASLL